MGRGEAVRGLGGILGRDARAQRTAAELFAERRAIEQLHHRVRRLTLAADVVDRHDVRVAERRDDAGFALEAGERL